MRSPLRVGIAAVSFVALALAAGCTASAPDDDAPSVLRIGVSPDQLAGQYNIVTSGLFAFDAKAVYDPLFLYEPDTFGYEPNLATEFERSDDWKTVTVTLRDDVTFVDGEKFNAEALVEFLEQIATYDEWQFKGIWDPYAPRFTVEDEYTVVMESDKPMDLRERGFLMQWLSYLPIASPKSFDDVEATATDPLGSGPYIVEDLEPGASATLVRNPDYWDNSRYPFDTIELTVFADEIAALNALQGGQIDTTQLTARLADQAQDQGFTLSEGNGRFTAMFVADWVGAVNPALGDQRVRQAMALAFDREAINEEFNLGYGTVTSQPFQEHLPEYVPGGEDRYGYDPEQARELLADAGYPDGFELTMPSTPFLNINQWEPIVQQYLGDIGIEVTFDEYADTGAYFTAIIGPNYPVFFYSEVFNQAIAVFINETAILNSYTFEDPYVEDRWDALQNGPDEVAEKAAAELGEYVLDEAILVPFSAVKYLWASAEGFQVHVGNLGLPPRVVDFQVAD
jgi:peptide/nickel transport system substrate-binding protein